MKLQKLVYYAHGWHLAIEKIPLTRQPFEAWQFGPVIPDLYREFKSYGADAVTDYAKEFDPVNQRRFVPQIISKQPNDEARSANTIIHDVWSIYGSYSAIRLSNDTHKDGTPWAKWYDPDKQHVVIPNRDIQNYFTSLNAKR